MKRYAPVAQRIRASDYGSEGYRFESCLAHRQRPCDESRKAFCYVDDDAAGCVAAAAGDAAVSLQYALEYKECAGPCNREPAHSPVALALVRCPLSLHGGQFLAVAYKDSGVVFSCEEAEDIAEAFDG